jgi:RNA polymerase sigma factor (TIGR02999 family)
MNDVTHILSAIEQGDPKAAGQLLPLVYDELRKLAACKMANEAPGQTLQPTALVHEAWLRLGGDQQTPWRNRAHFFSAAAEAMRRILIDRARHRRRVRRGGGQRPLNLDAVEEPATAADAEHVLAVDEALERFAIEDADRAELVKLRYFTGLTLAETAQVLGISESTAKRWWTFARAWLYREIRV